MENESAKLPSTPDLTPSVDRNKRFILIAGAVGAVLLILLAMFVFSYSGRSSNIKPTPTQSPNRDNGGTNTGGSGNQNSNNALPENKNVYSGKTRTDIKFSTLKEYSDAAEIFPNLNVKTKQAIDKVFTIQVTHMQDDSNKVVLQAKDPSFKLPSFIVGPTNKLYIIDVEKGLVPLGRLDDVGDSLFVLVDSEGYILAD